MIKEVIEQYKKSKIGIIALIVLLLFIFIGVFAPFFASSRPIMVCYEGKCYFPLFRYLFYGGFYTKPIDLFFNLFIVDFTGNYEDYLASQGNSAQLAGFNRA